MLFRYYEFHHEELDVVCRQHVLSFKTHMHSEMEILYLFEGSQQVVVDGREYTVEAGSCLVIFPNQPHSYIRPANIPRNNKDASWEMIFIPAQMLYSFYPDMHGQVTENCMLTADKLSEDAVLSLRKIHQTKTLNARVGWAHIILSDVIPQLAATKQAAGTDPELVSLIMGYISENYRTALTLDGLSQALGISKYKISRVFSQKVKMSFPTYLGMVRANHAAQLINRSDNTLDKIAQAAGFESTRSFYRIFRQVYGCSPAAYRDLVRKKRS